MSRRLFSRRLRAGLMDSEAAHNRLGDLLYEIVHNGVTIIDDEIEMRSRRRSGVPPETDHGRRCGAPHTASGEEGAAPAWRGPR